MGNKTSEQMVYSDCVHRLQTVGQSTNSNSTALGRHKQLEQQKRVADYPISPCSASLHLHATAQVVKLVTAA